MEHDISLVSTIAVGLVYALIGGYIASRLRLPPLAGYLLAGVAVGPFTPGFVADVHLAPQLAEIGVMLLMFGVGMHFSLGDLLAVKSIALPGAVLQMALTTGFGIGVAWLWGWPLGAGFVFGLALSVASTVVLLRALEAEHALHTREGRIAVGWLIVEDLAMVLVLVLLPALAVPLGGHALHAETGDGRSLWLTIAITLGKITAFVFLMLLAGRRLLPWMLKKIEQTGSRELFTLAVTALALGVAFGSAEFFGVSFALGAFFAGLVINESDLSKRAAKEMLPLQDAFSVLFFVAVGMLFDPMILIREPGKVLVTVLIIMVGKSLVAFCVAIAFRMKVRSALVIMAGLSQIGEFSFILAVLGQQLGLLSEEGSHLVLAGAMISITLNPFIFLLISKAIPHDAPGIAAAGVH
ncbi:MAG: cation:proton antiporter [Chthoniobacteraceae bacterium]